MNVRYALGSAGSKAMHALLSARSLPLMRAVPWGIAPWYDVQRIAGNRRLRTVFDVGANVGQTATSLVRYFPDAQIHCFEPAKEPVGRLMDQARRWPNVRVHPLALSDKVTTIEMLVGSGEYSELNTFVVDSEQNIHLGARETVAADTLDRFCDENGIERIELLKMDVQGWELKVLAGGARLLADGRIDFVFAEASFGAASRAMVPFSKIHEALTGYDFVLSGIYDCFRWGRKSEIHFCNCLYTRASLARLPL